MGRYCLYFLAFAFFVILSFESVFAEEFSSSNFRVLDPVLVPGNFSTSTNFRLFGNITQIATGTSTATNFNLSGGFLYFPSISTSTVGTVALDGKAGLYWSSATGGLGWSTIGGYNIGRSTTSGGQYTYDSVGNVTYAATSSLLNNLTNGTTYYFVVRAEDRFGNSVATSSEVSVIPTANQYHAYLQTLTTTQATTTTLFNSNGTKAYFDVPTDVLISGINLNTNFYSISEDAVVSSKPLLSGKLGANTFYELSFYKQSDLTQVTSLDKTISITFTYTDSDISGIDESTLGAYRWDGSSWTAISGSLVNASQNTVTFSTSNFSSFALLGSAPSSSGSSQQTASVAAASGGGGGGGGGGFGFLAPTISQKVTLNGRAYPGANVTIFKDGAVANTLRAGIDGVWKTDIPVIGGFYTFSVYATDSTNIRSLTSSFTLTIQSGQSMTISDVIIPPTISADKSQVRFGNDIKFFGYSFPDSSINVIINSEEQIIDETKAGKDGFWDYVLDSGILEKGDHTTRTQTITPDGAKSAFSESIAFRVGDTDTAFKRAIQKVAEKITPSITGACNKNGDINNDKKINLIDFSIMLFFWNQRNPSNACADINGDKIVNLFDFSIMLYYWTG